MLVVSDCHAGVVCDHPLLDGEDGLGVHLQPAHLRVMSTVRKERVVSMVRMMRIVWVSSFSQPTG